MKIEMSDSREANQFLYSLEGISEWIFYSVVTDYVYEKKKNVGFFLDT